MFCNKCGNRVQEYQSFCGVCGNKLVRNNNLMHNNIQPNINYGYNTPWVNQVYVVQNSSNDLIQQIIGAIGAGLAIIGYFMPYCYMYKFSETIQFSLFFSAFKGGRWGALCILWIFPILAIIDSYVMQSLGKFMAGALFLGMFAFFQDEENLGRGILFVKMQMGAYCLLISGIVLIISGISCLFYKRR